MNFDTSSADRAAMVDRPFSGFWLVLWSLGLSLGWLLPNHYAPWLAFHFDAWISTGLLIAAVVVVLRSHQPVPLHRFALVCGLAVGIPFVQFWFGLLPFGGQAWIGTAFLFGLLLTMVVGAYWDAVSPCQPVDGLFLAIGIAGIVSVGFALFQWLGLSVDAFDLWIMGTPDVRAFANFVQPNQLGTFLLWAILACGWGVARGRIGPGVAVLLAAYLLIGVALTQSRTASIGVIGLAAACVLWRRVWPTRTVAWAVLGLAGYYAMCIFTLPWLGSVLYLDDGLGLVSRVGDSELRLPAYRLLLDAALQAPYFGYGWAQTAVAQLAVAADHPSLGGIFMQAHNLFLDLVLWCGIGLGLLLSAALVVWFLAKVRRASSPQDAILVMFVGVVAWHAMLELPLHYAYMLLPTGLVMGVLNQRLAEPVVGRWNRWVFGVVVLAAIGLLGITVRDYLRIEQNFYVLRFERARIGTKPTGPPLSVVLLDHMNEFLQLGRTPARRGMTAQELEAMRKAALAYPALGNLFTLATALAWNEKTEEAQRLVNGIRGVSSRVQYAQMRRIWLASAQSDAALAAVSWRE